MPKIPFSTSGDKQTLETNKMSTRAQGADLGGNLSRLEGALGQSGQALEGLGDLFARIAIQKQQQDDLNFTNRWKLDVNKTIRQAHLSEKKKLGSDATPNPQKGQLGARASYLKNVTSIEKGFFNKVPDHLQDEFKQHWDEQSTIYEFNTIDHENKQRMVEIEAVRVATLGDLMEQSRLVPEGVHQYVSEYNQHIDNDARLGSYPPEVADLLKKEGASQIASFAVQQGILTSDNDVGPGSPPDYELRLGPKVNEFGGIIEPEEIARLIELAQKTRIYREEKGRILQEKAENDVKKAKAEELRVVQNEFSNNILEVVKSPISQQAAGIEALLRDIETDSTLNAEGNGSARLDLFATIKALAKNVDDARNPFLNSEVAPGGSQFATILSEISTPEGIKKWMTADGKPDNFKINNLLGSGLDKDEVPMLQNILSENVTSLNTTGSIPAQEGMALLNDDFKNFYLDIGYSADDIKDGDVTDEDILRRSYWFIDRQSRLMAAILKGEDPIEVYKKITAPDKEKQVKGWLSRFFGSRDTDELKAELGLNRVRVGTDKTGNPVYQLPDGTYVSE